MGNGHTTVARSLEELGEAHRSGKLASVVSVPHCQGIRKDGSACQSTLGLNAAGFCSHHREQAVETKRPTARGNLDRVRQLLTAYKVSGLDDQDRQEMRQLQAKLSDEQFAELTPDLPNWPPVCEETGQKFEPVLSARQIEALRAGHFELTAIRWPRLSPKGRELVERRKRGRESSTDPSTVQPAVPVSEPEPGEEPDQTGGNEMPNPDIDPFEVLAEHYRKQDEVAARKTAEEANRLKNQRFVARKMAEEAGLRLAEDTASGIGPQPDPVPTPNADSTGPDDSSPKTVKIVKPSGTKGGREIEVPEGGLGEYYPFARNVGGKIRVFKSKSAGDFYDVATSSFDARVDLEGADPTKLDDRLPSGKPAVESSKFKTLFTFGRGR